MIIAQGTLWKHLLETTEHALKVGALLPVQTNPAFIEEQGVRYFVRVLESLRRKDEARKQQDQAARAGKKVNPFLPPEPDLTVGDVTDTHTAILNKFNVLDHHLLIVTKQFEDQDILLTVRDFDALWRCMAEFESLGFYNGGREAGASQQHKHLQLVPLPLVPGGAAVPVEPLLRAAPAGHRITQVPAFPFIHAFSRLDKPHALPPSEAAGQAYALYSAMLEQVGIEPPVQGSAKRHSKPYCLLITREWMLLVPRSREFFENISVNSLAFAGSFFVRSEEELERLRTYGPLNVLKAVAAGHQE